jgi:hypothetical protein
MLLHGRTPSGFFRGEVKNCKQPAQVRTFTLIVLIEAFKKKGLTKEIWIYPGSDGKFIKEALNHKAIE